jgi:tuftelin-interacting protein 11
LSSHEASQRRQLQAMETIAGTVEQVLNARFREEINFKMCSIAWMACQFAHPLLVRTF